MSIIQRIRDRAAWLIFGAIALAMIGFIVTDAFQGGGGGLFNSQPTTIAKINGEKIDYTTYQTRVKQQIDAQPGLDDRTREMVENQVWNQMVEETILKEAFDDLGLYISDKEVSDMLYGPNPPAEVRQQFANPQTGEFDPSVVYPTLERVRRERPQQYDMFMQALVYIRQRQKYLSLLQNTVYVPKWMVERNNVDNSLMAKMSYVVVPYTTVPDSAVTVSDQDVQDYINKHKEQFRQEESRSISYVAFSAAPSAADTAAVRQQLLNVKTEFDTTTDHIGFLARNGTETEFSNTFVTGHSLSIPYKDSITNLPEGAVFGPYQDGGTFVLAKMIARRNMPDSVKVRHILISTQTGTTDSAAKARIDSVKRVLESGSDWKTVAAQVSEDPGSKDNGGEYEFSSIQFTNLAPEFAEFAFYGQKGDKGIVKTSFGYHYMEVMDQKKIGPAYKVAYLSKAIVPSTETINTASGLASQFAGQSRTRKAFDENAAKNPLLQKIPVDNILPYSSEIPGLGFNRQLVQWIYRADVGDVSEFFSVDDKYVVAVVTEINEEGTMSVKKARPMVEVLIRNQKKAAQIGQKIGKPASLEAVTTSTGQPVHTVDSLAFAMSSIPNAGNEPKVIGAAFNKAWENKISEPIGGNMGVYVIKPGPIFAVPNPNADIERQRQFTQQALRSQVAQRALFGLRRGANIKDYRGEF